MERRNERRKEGKMEGWMDEREEEDEREGEDGRTCGKVGNEDLPPSLNDFPPSCEKEGKKEGRKTK